jgi:predicted GNAT family N-acyltransferase
MRTRSATAATPRPSSSSDPTGEPSPIGVLAVEGTIPCRALVDGRDPIHGAIAPADVRVGDPVVARVRAAGGAELAAQVWRISPLAAEIVRAPALGAISVGDTLDLTLRVGGSETTLRRVPVVGVHEERGRELLALRWAPEDAPRAVGSEQRAASRWACGAEYLPTGVMPSAVRYNDFIHFRIAEISRTGMRLVTSLRNKFLVPGVSFEATCAFPTVGEVRIAFRVVHARVVAEGGKEALALGTTYAVRDARSLERIGQYLLQFGAGTTMSELRATGFPVRASSRAVDFGFVRTPEEYREVLALRRLAYVHAKKASADVKDVDMGDGFDARSRIVYARHAGRIVASVRLMFPRDATDALKHEEYLALPGLPPRDQIVEASKACTHPDFRGGDLFYRLMHLAALTTMQAGRKHILMSCTRALLPVYCKLGFRPFRAEYVHPSMGIAHQVLLAEVSHMVCGVHMSPLVWHLIDVKGLWDFACRCGVVRRTRWLDARVALYRLFAPIAWIVRPLVLRRLAGRHS